MSLGRGLGALLGGVIAVGVLSHVLHSCMMCGRKSKLHNGVCMSCHRDRHARRII
jgi:hypothetical protein